MDLELQLMLQEVEASVQGLEQLASSTQSIVQVSSSTSENNANGENATWAFDRPDRPKQTRKLAKSANKVPGKQLEQTLSSNQNDRYYGRKVVKRKEEVRPSVGAYEPNYDAVKRSVPGLVMKPSKGRTLAWERKAEGGDALDLDVEGSMDKSSRFRNAPGVRLSAGESVQYEKTDMNKSKKKKEKTRDDEVKATVGAYDPNYSLVQKRTQGFSFAPPKRVEYETLKRAKTTTAGEEEQDQNKTAPAKEKELDVEKCLQVVEPRAKGVCAWVLPTNKSKTKDLEKMSAESVVLDVDKAWKSLEPTVKGGVAWMPNYYKIKPKPVAENRTETEKATKPKQTAPVPMPSAGFAKPTEMTKVRAKHLLKQQQMERSLGPGAYLDSEQLSTFKLAKTGEKTSATDATKAALLSKKRKRRLAETQKVPDPGMYDTINAWAATRPRVRGGLSFDKAPKRFSSPKAEERPVTEETARSFTVESDSSSLSSSASAFSSSDEDSFYGDEVKRGGESKYHSDNDSDGSFYRESKNHESKNHLSSEDEEDAELELLGRWLDKVKKRTRSRKTKTLRKTSTNSNEKKKKKTKQIEVGQELTREKVESSAPMAIFQKSFKESASARRYLILQRHERKKQMEARGSSQALEPKHSVVEKSLGVGAISMEKVEESRKKQEEMNKKIWAKIEAQNATREAKLLAKLGIDASWLEEGRDWKDEVLSPSKLKGFKYHEPTKIPSPVRRVLEERKYHEKELGPGMYESTIHRAWVEEEDALLDILQRIKSARNDMTQYENDPTSEKHFNDAKLEWQDAQQEYKRFKESNIMSKLLGRERTKIVKGRKKVIQFSEVEPEDEDMAKLGPGKYSVPENVSRFGVDRRDRGVLDYSKLPERIEPEFEDDYDDFGPLDLDVDKALEVARKTEPGTRGFMFSQLKHDRLESIKKNDAEDDEQKLDLDPNFEYGKFYEPGKNLVSMHKTTGRQIMEEKDDEDKEGQVLDLSPGRSKRYLEGDVKVINMDTGLSRDLFDMEDFGDEDMPPDAYANMEGFQQAVYEPNLDAVKPRTNKQVPDFSKGMPRFEIDVGDEEMAPPTAWDSEYDVNRGIDATKKRSGIGLVSMDAQTTRKDDEDGKDVPAYRHAVYPGAEVDPSSILGGRNSKGVVRKAAAKTMVDMKKDPSTSRMAEEMDEHMALDLDPVSGKEYVGKRFDKGLVAMDTACPRWEEQEKELIRKAKERPLSPITELVDQARTKLSIQEKSKRPNPKGHMDMSKWLGRESKEKEEEPVLKIDPVVARDAPSQNTRITGGILDKAKRSGSPSSKYAKEKADQGNVLVLNPDTTYLEPRKDKILVPLDKQTGRNTNSSSMDEDNTVIMSDVPKPDVVKGLESIEPRVVGGSVGLHKLSSNPVLQKKQKQEQIAARKLRGQVSLKIQELKEKVKQERAVQLAKAKNIDENTKSKENEKKPRKTLATTKKKEGVIIQRGKTVS